MDVPNGLVVPSADAKTIEEIAADVRSLRDEARGKGLPLTKMSGGSFTISSLGAIGGLGFTPIIKAPEVAILGAGRAQRKPFESNDGQIVWQNMLPMTLSYDHRVINCVIAGSFCRELSQALLDAGQL